MHKMLLPGPSDSIQNEANEVFNSMLQDNSTDAGMEATQKMKALVADLNKLKKHNQSRIG